MISSRIGARLSSKLLPVIQARWHAAVSASSLRPSDHVLIAAIQTRFFGLAHALNMPMHPATTSQPTTKVSEAQPRSNVW